MSTMQDGPASPHFAPLPFRGNASLPALAGDAGATPPPGMSAEMAAALEHAPGGSCVCWGIPFEVGDVLLLADGPVSVEVPPTRARWLVFMHTSDIRPLEPGPGGIISPSRGLGHLAEHAADYVIRYAGGKEVRVTIRRRHQLGPFTREWGVNCFEAVAAHKPHPVRAAQEQPNPRWGWSQTRVVIGDEGPWINWLWAWENPHPDKAIVGVRFEPMADGLDTSGLSTSGLSTSGLSRSRSSTLHLGHRDRATFQVKIGLGMRRVFDQYVAL
jgi:hypothetical protein